MSKEDNNSVEEGQSTPAESDAGMDENDKAILHTMQQHFDFSLKLLRSLASDKKGESSIVSPISVAISFAMVYGGASGETAKQIEQLLPKVYSAITSGPNVDVDAFHEHFGKLFQTIKIVDERQNRTTDANRTLEIVNQVYMQNGDNFTVHDTFNALLNKHYGGNGENIFELIDFAEKEATVERINKSVSVATHGKINNFIDAKMLDGQICLMLINACYFKGCWKSKFKPEETKKKYFYTGWIKRKKIDMMQKERTFLYVEKKNYKVLGIPYDTKSDVLILFLLPKARCGLDKLLKEMDGEKLVDCVFKGENREVKVELPKFKLESRFDLSDPLKRLGVVKAFTEGEAELGGIGTGGAGQSLRIGHCLQQALIEVNEEGTEAAAVTEVAVYRWYNLCFPSDNDVRKPAKFIANHPFAFFLIYTNSAQKQHCVLFSGTFYG